MDWEGLKHLATAIVPGIYDPALPSRTEFVATERCGGSGAAPGETDGVVRGGGRPAAAIVAAERVSSARGMVVVIRAGRRHPLSQRATFMTLVLDARHVAAISRHGEADYPAEACG